VALGFPRRLRPRIFTTFGATRVVGRQPNAPAAFTPGEIPGTHFQRLNRPQGTWFCGRNHGKKPQWHNRGSIPGPSDHYATPGKFNICVNFLFVEGVGLNPNDLALLVQKQHWFVSLFRPSSNKTFCRKYQVFVGKIIVCCTTITFT